MAKLDAAKTRAIVRILREHLRLIRELVAARTILAVCEKTGTCPTGWKESLEDLVANPQHNTAVQELETLIVRLEQDADETDLNAWLEKFSKESPIH